MERNGLVFFLKLFPGLMESHRVSHYLATKPTVRLIFLDQGSGGEIGLWGWSQRAFTLSVDSPSKPNGSWEPNAVFMAPGTQPSRLKRAKWMPRKPLPIHLARANSLSPSKRSREVRRRWSNNLGLDWNRWAENAPHRASIRLRTTSKRRGIAKGHRHPVGAIQAKEGRIALNGGDGAMNFVLHRFQPTAEIAI